MSVTRLGKLPDEKPGAGTPIAGEIHDTARTDQEPAREPFPGGPVAEAGNLNSLIERVSSTSVAEIEKLIVELQVFRDLLHSEGQRVQHEIAGYARLGQAAMNSARLIAEGLSEWKSTGRS
jgi:hypothetical protein